MTRTILIISGSSDIGLDMIDRYLTAGHKVIATYRNPKHFEIKKNKNRENLTAFPLHIENYIQRYKLYNYLLDTKTCWDTVIFLNATVKPIGPFMEVDGPQWEKSIENNALTPCTFLQRLYKVRDKEKICNVCFFSGGGVNNPFDNYSAYSISKLILTKMCELLDSEYDDLNPFIVGPSFTKTKIHQETMDNKENAGVSWQKTLDLINNDPGTPLEDIYNCVEWCCKRGKKVVGGRNIAVRHDSWKDDKDLVKKLKNDINMYKLRRST